MIEVDEAVGEYRIVVLRNEPFGNLNGYLGVPLHSSHYGDDYDDFDVPVHGGWTYFAGDLKSVMTGGKQKKGSEGGKVDFESLLKKADEARKNI